MIPLYNVPNYRKKNPTVYSGTSLNTEPIEIHQLKSHPNLKSKYKESTPSSHDVVSSWILTEVDYSSTFYHKPTRRN